MFSDQRKYEILPALAREREREREREYEILEGLAYPVKGEEFIDVACL
jgi:hypothetical protein